MSEPPELRVRGTAPRARFGEHGPGSPLVLLDEGRFHRPTANARRRARTGAVRGPRGIRPASRGRRVHRGESAAQPLHKEQVSVLGFHAGSGHVWLATSSGEGMRLDDADGSVRSPRRSPGGVRCGPSSVALGKLDVSEALAVLTHGALHLWDPRSGEELTRTIEASPSGACQMVCGSCSSSELE